MGLLTTANGKSTSRVRLPGHAHIPAGAENLVGEERLPGGALGVGPVGRIGMAVHATGRRLQLRPDKIPLTGITVSTAIILSDTRAYP